MFEDPLETYLNNYESTCAVLGVAEALGCRVFLASTSEVYGDAGRLAVAEDRAPDIRAESSGRAAYARSKPPSEHLCRVYARAHGIPIVIGRLFNTIGARQRSEYGMVVPRFIRQAAAGDPITVFGDGSQTRSFCSVEDTTLSHRGPLR